MKNNNKVIHYHENTIKVIHYNENTNKVIITMKTIIK